MDTSISYSKGGSLSWLSFFQLFLFASLFQLMPLTRVPWVTGSKELPSITRRLHRWEDGHMCSWFLFLLFLLSGVFKRSEERLRLLTCSTTKQWARTRTRSGLKPELFMLRVSLQKTVQAIFWNWPLREFLPDQGVK